MDKIRVSICAVFALLVGISVYFYVNTGEANHREDKSIAQLNYELEQAYIDEDLNDSITFSTQATPANTGASSLTSFEPEEKVMAQEEIKRQADELEAQQLKDAQAQNEAKLSSDEIPATDETRIQLIAQALVMARVKDYDEANRITLLSIERPESVVPSQILGIRRQRSGIIGRLSVASVEEGNHAFADPIPASFFGGEIDIRVGDELIVVP